MIRKDGILPSVLFAFAVSLLVYLLTMSRSVGWHDSAELALTAWLPAPSHAPGSPLHALLAWLPARLMSEAWQATTLISVLTAALAAGLLAGLIRRLAGDAVVAVLAAVLYALSFQVWATAVITELYGLSMMLLAAAMLAAFHWQQEGSERSWLLMLLAYCLSLGAYFANILLWPAFAFLIYISGERQVRPVLLFAVVTASAVLLIAAANYLLAAQSFPFGAVRPDSLAGLFEYMSGAQHDPLQARPGLGRIIEHLEIISRSTGYLPLLLAVAGFIYFRQRYAIYTWFSAIVGFTYLIYYTLFGSGDYYLMVSPVYFVLMMWAAGGLLWAGEKLPITDKRLPVYTVLVLLVGMQVYLQFEGRRGMALDKSAEAFAAETFDILPADAVAIAGWKELTTLNYFQVLHRKRQDIRFILPARERRYYRHGVVEDYVAFTQGLVCSNPVFTMKPVPDLDLQLESVKGPVRADWQRISPPQDECERDRRSNQSES